MSNPIDQLKGVNNTAPLVTEPTPIQPNEPVAQRSVFAGEAGIDPSLYNPDGSLLQSPVSAPNIEPEVQAPLVAVAEEGLAPLQAAAPIQVGQVAPVSTAGYAPSGISQIGQIVDPVNRARSAEAANLQGIAARGVEAAAKVQPTTWALPDIDTSLASYGNNTDALQASFKRQTAARVADNEAAWLEANMKAIEAMQKPENSATGNAMSWVQNVLGLASSEDSGRKYVNIVKLGDDGQWRGSGIGAVLYGLGLAQNAVVGAALDAGQLFRNVDKSISEAYNRYTPPWARGTTDTALKTLSYLLPQASLFRDAALKPNRYFDGKSNLVEAIRGAQFSFSDKSGEGIGVMQDIGLGTFATWNPNYGKPGQPMFIDSKVDLNPTFVVGVALDVVTGGLVDGALGKIAQRLGLKPGIVSKTLGVQLGGPPSVPKKPAGSNPRAVTPKQQAEAAAARASSTAPVQGEIPFLTGPVPSAPKVEPKLPKGMRPKATKAPRSPVNRGGAVQLELQISEMMSKPSAGEVSVRPDAYKDGLRGRKGKDGGGQLEMRLGELPDVKPAKDSTEVKRMLYKEGQSPTPVKGASVAKPPQQFKFDPFNPDELGARGFEPKNAKVATVGTQFELPLGVKKTPAVKEAKLPKVPVKLDSTVEQLGFDPFKPGELGARGYEAVNIKKTQYVNKETGNQLTLSVPVEKTIPRTPAATPGSLEFKPRSRNGVQQRLNFDVMPEAFAPKPTAANPTVATGARKATIEAVQLLDPVTVPLERVAKEATKAGLDPVAQVADVVALRKEYGVLSKKLDRATEKTMGEITQRMADIDGQLKTLVNPQPAAISDLIEASVEGRRLNRDAADLSMSLDNSSASYTQQLEDGNMGRQMLTEAGEDTVPYPPRTPETPTPVVVKVHVVEPGEKLFHGTQVKNYPLNEMNPLDGAASSEMGLGVYLTRSEDVATEAAKATRNPDVPSLASRPQTDGSGQVRVVLGVDKLHIVNAADTNPRISELVYQAIDSGGGRFKALLEFDSPVVVDSILTALDDAQKAFDDPDTLRAFQRAFTEQLLDDGIDGAISGGNIVIYRTASLDDMGAIIETGVQGLDDAGDARILLDRWALKQIDQGGSDFLRTVLAQVETGRFAQALSDIELFKEAAANKAFSAVERSGLLDNPTRIPTLDEFVRLTVSDPTESYSNFSMTYGAEKPELVEALLAYADRRGIKVVMNDEATAAAGAAGSMSGGTGVLKLAPEYSNSLEVLLHEIGHDLIKGTINSRTNTTFNEMTVEAAAQAALTIINPRLTIQSQSKLTWFFKQVQPGGGYDKPNNILTKMTREEFIKSNGELVAQLTTKLLNEIAPNIKVPPIKANRIFTPEAFTQYIDGVVADNGSKSLSALLKKSYVTIDDADQPTLAMVEKFATNPITGKINDNAVDVLVARYGTDIAPTPNYPVKLQGVIDSALDEGGAIEYAGRLALGDDPYDVLNDIAAKYPELGDDLVKRTRDDIDEYLQHINCN